MERESDRDKAIKSVVIAAIERYEAAKYGVVLNKRLDEAVEKLLEIGW